MTSPILPPMMGRSSTSCVHKTCALDPRLLPITRLLQADDLCSQARGPSMGLVGGGPGRLPLHGEVLEGQDLSLELVLVPLDLNARSGSEFRPLPGTFHE